MAACGGDRPVDERVGVYVAVVRTVADLPDEPVEPAEARPLVFVDELTDEVRIPLPVQAAVVTELEPVAAVRFIDDWAEAVDDALPDRPVRDGGVLVALGAVTPVGDERAVPARRYRSEADDGQVLVTVRREGERWRVVQEAPLEG